MDAVLLQKGEEGIHINNGILETIPYEDEIIQKVFFEIKEQSMLSIKEDTLGILFEKLILEREKKDLGQFYTPQDIVDYIINFLNIKINSKILDPTCGCGIFLVTAYNHLKHLNPDALDNIYGVDLNETAAKITRINLWFKSGHNLNSLNVLEKNIKIGNSIVENNKISNKSFDWKQEFHDILNNGGFDFIIGNPPYVTLKNGRDYDVKESIYSEIANGNTNAASLVIAKSYELLKENGIMAFVLPKTLIRVNSYSKLRDFVLSNSKILHIYDLGNCFDGVRGEQIILFVQKTNSKDETEKNRVLIKVFEDKEKTLYAQKEFYMPQKLFRKYNRFLIFKKGSFYDLIEKISGDMLENIASIFRGISLSPNSPHITKIKNNDMVPIIKGNNISKFSYSNTYFVDYTKIKDSSIKLKQLKKEKIILQNIFSSEAGIISGIDNKGNLNFDTVTNIVLNDKNFDIRYILGLLNSKLINFYLIYAIYNKSKLTMHTDKIYIGRIPVKKISKQKQDDIVNIVNGIEKSKEKSEDKKKLLNMLDKEIYNLYGINKKDQNLIESSLKEIMSEKSLW